MMIIDDGCDDDWWLMMIDDDWWCLMMIDDVDVDVDVDDDDDDDGWWCWWWRWKRWWCRRRWWYWATKNGIMWFEILIQDCYGQDDCSDIGKSTLYTQSSWCCRKKCKDKLPNSSLIVRIIRDVSQRNANSSSAGRKHDQMLIIPGRGLDQVLPKIQFIPRRCWCHGPKTIRSATGSDF